MTFAQYEDEKKLAKSTLALIRLANQIIDEYQAQGYTLTLRQLYYQFVSRDWLPNHDRMYKMLGTAVSTGRMQGLISWEALEDRTRQPLERQRWASGAEILRAAADSYHVDRWAECDCYVEVWVEKEALVGVLENICRQWGVTYFACRGYVSQSAQWRAGRRLLEAKERGQRPVILHLGDHDPSGIDMTRDNEKRLSTFAECDWHEDIEVWRLALNMDQIEEYGPPPNPAKLTDSRAREYIAQYGRSSWELDALEPRVLTDMVDDALRELVDRDAYERAVDREKEEKKALVKLADEWEEKE